MTYWKDFIEALEEYRKEQIELQKPKKIEKRLENYT